MSQENVEMARRAYAAFNRGDSEGLAADLAPDFEYVTTGAIPGVGGVYRGPEGLRRFLESFWGAFDEPGLEVRELIEAEDQVLAGLTFQGRGKQSGVERPHGTSGTFGRCGAARSCAGRRSRAGNRPSKPPGFGSSTARRFGSLPVRSATGTVPSIRRFEWFWRRLRRRLSWQAVAAEFSWARVAGALLIALLLAGVGFGAYLLARPDVNQEALRATAIADGREAGAQKGAKQGYEQGYESARDRVHAPAYAAAYRAAYASEFERADLDPPQPIQVPEPR